MHLHETAAEVEAARRELGSSHIHYLADLGLLVPRLQAVHLTQVDDAELELLAESGVRAVHCPQSNLKLGSGTCDIERMQATRTRSSDSAPTAPPRTTRSICSPRCALRRCSRRRSPATRGARCVRRARIRNARQRPRARPRRNDRLDRSRQSRGSDFRRPDLLRRAAGASSRSDAGVRRLGQPRAPRVDRRPARAGRRQADDVGRSGDSRARARAGRRASRRWPDVAPLQHRHARDAP